MEVPVLRDADRPLSQRGEHDAALVGRLLAVVEPSARTIGSSPLVRARQTASIVASRFRTPPVVTPWPVLEPGIAMREVLAQVTEHADDSLILVAHQPDITEFLCWLVADGIAEIAFPPGSVASVVLSTTSGDRRCTAPVDRDPGSCFITPSRVVRRESCKCSLSVSRSPMI